MNQTVDASGLATPTPRLITLGAAELVYANGQKSTLLGPGKPLALIAYLAAAPGLTARREHLIDLLWADLDPDAARHALRQTLWYVRQRAGELLDATRDAVALRAPLPSDRADLLAALDHQDCDRVVERYTGEFLPGLALPGGGEFEQWADLERRHLRSAYMRCGDAVARRHLTAGRARDAVLLARRLRDTDPDAEPAWRLLLESLLSARDMLGAGAEADALTRRFAAESREPEPATRALLRRATATPSATVESPAPASLATELIGRGEEFRRLLAAWDDARAGRFRHVHLVAPAGIGKSRLLADVASRLRARGARVLTVRVRPGDRSLPQAAAGDIAAALAALPGAAGISSGAARSIIALHPSLSSQYAAEPDPATGEEGVRRRAVALQELVAAVADDAPLCLLIDDVHWMDDVSHRMVTSVLQRLEELRVLVVTTSRPRYASLASPATEEIALQPLTPQQTGALVATLGALPAEPWADGFPDALHASTAGSPLLLLESLQLLLERGHLRLDNATWSTPDPATLDDALCAGSALGARLARLASGERALVLVLAIAGIPLDAHAVARVARHPDGDAERLLGALEQRGLVTRLDQRWSIAHDAIGEAGVDLASDAELRPLHLALGEHWMAEGARDIHAIRRAAEHFAAGRADTRVRAAFTAWLRLARRAGDARPLHELAIEFAGSANGNLVSRLAASAPVHLRFPRRTLASAGIAALATLVVLASLQRRSDAGAVQPDAVVIAAAPLAGGADTQVVALPLRRNEGRRQTLFDAGELGLITAAIPNPHSLARLAPDSSSWVVDRVYGDSGGFDIALVDARTGRERRLTSARTDQGDPAWSPDGRYLVFSTGEFDPLQHRQLAIMHVASGATRRLTRGGHTDARPAWHPTGTFIGFSRRYWDRPRPMALCTITVDGLREDCFPVQGLQAFDVLGWYDEHRVVVQRYSPHRFGLVDITTREFRAIGRFTGGGYADASPDGRWIACDCQPLDNPHARGRLTVFSIDDPENWRQVIAGGTDERAVRFVWASRPATHRYAARLDVAPAFVALNARAQLRAVARDGERRVLAGIPMAWRSLTPGIATIDGVTGVLLPHAAGDARIVVSAGGWLSTELVVTVTRPAAQITLEEDWRRGFGAFVPYGIPKPFIRTDPRLGVAMAPNGDGSFGSGVYSRQPLDAARGVAVELEVRLPITMNQWQAFGVHFASPVSEDSLGSWDHENGRSPFRPLPETSECVALMPAGEGPEEVGYLAVMDQRISAPRALLSGEPHRLTLQFFPDGSCGLALDGRPLSWVPGRWPPAAGLRLVISGNSFRTNIAVGRVRVYSGVIPGLDWRRANQGRDLRPPG